MKKIAIVSALSLFSAILSQEVDKTFQSKVEIEKDQDFKINKVKEFEKQKDEEEKRSYAENENLNNEYSYDNERDVKLSKNKLKENKLKTSKAKNLGSNIRKLNSKQYEENLENDSNVQKDLNEKNYRNKELTNECVEEEEHEQHYKHNDDSKTRNVKTVKRRADKKGFNLLAKEGKEEKLKLNKNKKRNKAFNESDDLLRGEKCDEDVERFVVNINKFAREHEVDEEGTRKENSSRNKNFEIKEKESKKINEKDEFNLNKEKDFKLSNVKKEEIKRKD